MKTANLRKNAILMLILTIMGVFVSIASPLLNANNVHAATISADNQKQIKEDLETYQEAFVFDKKNNTVIFSGSKASSLGLNSQEAKTTANFFNSLSDDQKANILREFSNVNPNARIAPLLIWAAGVLGGWLANKLLDWGAHRFCSKFRYNNGATRFVCSVID